MAVIGHGTDKIKTAGIENGTFCPIMRVMKISGDNDAYNQKREP